MPNLQPIGTKTQNGYVVEFIGHLGSNWTKDAKNTTLPLMNQIMYIFQHNMF